ncbi:MAG: chemotaxis protein CheW [Flavobacteriales bacterium]|nr:chemotaxis protein CheW [Flavobacteriales bacterium]
MENIQNKELTLEQVRSQVAKTEDAESKGERIQLIVFQLGSGEYAIPIDDIKEIVLTPGIAKVPRTPSFIKGVANIRGSIVAIMDLEERFGLEKTEITSQSYTLVIASTDFKVGILVSKVPNTLNTYSSEIDSTDNIMHYSNVDQKCINGIAKVEDRLIMLLDVQKLLDFQGLYEIKNI